MPVKTYAEALCQSLIDTCEAEPNLIFIPAAFGGLSPHAASFRPFYARYADRILGAPIAEIALCGIGVGAAIGGLRPVIDVLSASFLYQGIAQVVNEAANVLYMTDGKTACPVIFHAMQGVLPGEAAQHNRCLSAELWNSPGLEIVLPASPEDAAGLWKTAVASPNPTVFMDHQLLMGLTQDVPDHVDPIPFGQARICREGKDVTVVATLAAVPRALEAAERLAREDGVAVEVVDPRTLVPFDEETVVQSVRKTGRAVVADETIRSCGVAAEIAARIQERCWGVLKAPVKRVTLPDVPIPFSRPQEAVVWLTPEKIAQAVREVLAWR
ncbi:MAG: alpha-ketoacid dehydrogenase subunit beta [Firmicutes bacterium]|nr:alpha-ketoacid dehydrogenase subunit beta [Alicyclobacillaceae bacterium]MCL6496067.1 alpha-ketoacid dehydrogenase subunit beta [Bacillota bacterium]